MILSLVLNAVIVLGGNHQFIYMALLAAQLAFYGAALLGWILEQRQVKVKTLFVPYYFCMMNYAVIAGLKRYFSKGQSAVWEKAKRK